MEIEYIIGITLAMVIVGCFICSIFLINGIETEKVKNWFRIKNRNKIVLNRFYVKIDNYDYETWERDTILVYRVVDIGKNKIRFRPWGAVGEYEDGRFKERPKDIMVMDKKNFLTYYRLLAPTLTQKKRETFDKQLQDVIE